MNITSERKRVWMELKINGAIKVERINGGR
jgi:hypothetical protein